jgi:hypothetical protein
VFHCSKEAMIMAHGSTITYLVRYLRACRITFFSRCFWDHGLRLLLLIAHTAGWLRTKNVGISSAFVSLPRSSHPLACSQRPVKPRLVYRHDMTSSVMKTMVVRGEASRRSLQRMLLISQLLRRSRPRYSKRRQICKHARRIIGQKNLAAMLGAHSSRFLM